MLVGQIGDIGMNASMDIHTSLQSVVEPHKPGYAQNVGRLLEAWGIDCRLATMRALH